jgi:hypothetical protein
MGAKMTEARKHKDFEELCGSPDRAFRLMRLHVACKEAASGSCFTLRKLPSTEERFIRRAKEEGYSKEAINAFLNL